MALTNLEKFRRLKINDNYRNFSQTHQADGEAKDWDCHYYPIRAGSYTAYLDGVATLAYTASLDDGRFTFSAAPANATQIRIVGQYSTFSDTELSEILAEHGIATGATAATLESLDAPLITAIETLLSDAWKRHTWSAAGGQSVSEGQLFQNLLAWRKMLEDKSKGLEIGPQGGIESYAENQDMYTDRYQG